jgi:hypothetical protein
MKHLRRYNENTNYEDMGESIKDILLDISDEGYHVNYSYLSPPRFDKIRFDIIISTFDVQQVGVFVGADIIKPDKLEWDNISDTIHRIESYLADFDFNYKWEIWVDKGDRWDVHDSLSEIDGVNPSSKEYQINIEIQ